MTTHKTGDVVRLTSDVDLFGGSFTAGTRLRVLEAWPLTAGSQLLNVVGDDGRRICSLPADRVEPIAPATKPASKSRTVRRTGGTLWD